ncbi:MAG: DivIVA domain-containing protein [Pseudodesulfovibrio sp.]|uniref:DivIVA domain protein n=1 Tax=Pseudodesulfovibrio aespoeensis (strain ATCC 700646 / DSM 10631 / Aspo-2) TaxID=643562 RepID=E6VZ14_PSEA9|nr:MULTISPECIES: DivIVA domain-containing protein [Pseudodesulfovibrio]MBU4191843.1 DivIVA domain-containing protein [Pseudomonadota bacterium]MCG2731686.1 DivIVA domain-containing protein [Pseudodesulfovibrio aespoeensis]ADU62790.1 DivIVA domain protein [Pseudodesulfovibrio aespoeensis Aspo-2]MBU4245300.1 DivIVA domain-containing protein [Pseudomonadota bacterium]MBU4379591.1 DivIVA domain-containing protein [Pseudomonadota bacterium]
MTVSKIDLLNKQFSRGVFGYSRMEVEQFLLELAEVLGESADAQKSMRKKIKQMEQSLKEYRQRDETLRDTLMSTQKMVDDLKVAATREAQLILDEARAKADSTVQKGHNRLAQIHEEIEDLKRRRVQFEVQLKGLLKSHLEMLEMSDPEKNKVEELESKLMYLKKVD